MRQTLDELAARGAAALRDRNVRYFLREGLPAVLASLALAPLFVCALQFLQSLAGVEPWRPGVAGLVAAMLLTALGLAWWITQWARRLPIDRRAALGLLDRAAGAGERLVTADQLLREGADDPFARAAVEDARWFVKPATAAEPVPPPNPRPTSSLLRGVLWALAGFAFLYATQHPVAPAGAGDLTIESADQPHRIPDLGRELDTPERAPAEKPAPETRTPASDAQAPTKASDAAAPSKPSDLPEEAQRKEGKGGAGRSAQAQGSRGDNDARGSPTEQGQPTPKPPTTKKPLPKKKRKKKPAKPGSDEKPEQQQGEESGSTAGRGSSRGSNKNAVTSDWKSKDQVTTDEDEDIEDDEEVEDEEVDSEARGGVQPNLRDRKPPVSRDLTIGFGNQPNPNANGRGGPSQPKKSRGTASLVLGVPIPDRIKGQPNPGKTKVTQERVEPRRERAPSEQAQARAPRDGPTGPLARPALEPWMQELLRAWFQSLRQQEKSTR